MSDTLRKMWETSYLSGQNMAYVDSLYEDYLDDPTSVSASWRAVFQALPKNQDGHTDVSHRALSAYFRDQVTHRRADLQTNQVGIAGDDKQRRVADLIHAYRANGHLVAKLDPLHMLVRETPPSLTLAYHGLSEAWR